MTTASHTLAIHQLPTVPKHTGPWPFGWLFAFRRDPLGVMFDAVREHGDLVRMTLGPMDAHIVRAPEHVKHVLVDNNKNYDKRTHTYGKLRLFLGDGLLTSEGDFWRRQRRIAQPAFHRKRIAAFGTTMADMTAQMLDGWSEQVDVAREMTGLTLRIATKTLLNADVHDDDNRVGEAVHDLNHAANVMMGSLFPWPQLVPSPTVLRYYRAGRTLDGIVNGLVAERRRTGEDAGDLLSMFMHVRDEETGEQMNDRQLRDEVMTMFLAGHETTANTLAWTFYLLSTHPAVEKRMRAELDEVLGGRRPEASDYKRLEYTERIVKEAMRLYPPAWVFSRNARGDDRIGDYRVRKGAFMLLSPYVTHRDPKLWPNPEAFDRIGSSRRSSANAPSTPTTRSAAARASASATGSR